MAEVDDNDQGSGVSAPMYGQADSLDGGDRPILLVPAIMGSKKAKHLAPQQTVDEFWSKFDSKTPGKGITQ
jgi:hypothetical protein